jgi:hypothetical protein
MNKIFLDELEPHLWCNGSGVFALTAVDRGFESRFGQTKDYEIGMCCFSAKHAAVRNQVKSGFILRVLQRCDEQ